MNVEKGRRLYLVLAVGVLPPTTGNEQKEKKKERTKFHEKVKSKKREEEI